MRASFHALIAGLLASTVTAAPNHLFERQACNRDNCLRAVGPTASSALSRGSTDCASFLMKTVYACVATSTATTTTTISASAVTTTMVTGTVTSTISSTVSTTSVQSTTVTSTATANSVSTILSSTTSTVTSTSTALTTVTTTVSAVAKRQVACNSPVTAVPTATPSYASACQNTSRYSSACSCIGVTSASTTTIATGSTSLSTTTISVTVTPTVTVGGATTVTITTTSVVSVASNAVSSAVTTTTVISSTTSFSTILETKSTTVTSTSTITTTKPTAVTQNLELVFSASGQHLDIAADDDDTINAISGPTAMYVPVAILKDGSVAAAENPDYIMYVAPRSAGGYAVKFGVDQTDSSKLRCTIPDNTATSGAFTCSYNDQNASFFLCGDDKRFTVGLTSAPVTGCTATTISINKATYDPSP